MKKLFIVLFISLLLQIEGTAAISFPLNVGNKWYYQAGSTRNEFYYGVIKEITDTLSNGFREVTSKYYYQDSIHVSKEFWAYLNSKFYFNSTAPSLNYAYRCFDDSLSKDTCISDYECWSLIEYRIFNMADTVQAYENFKLGHLSSSADRITTFPGIGIVMKEFIVNPPYIKDSTYLIGIYKDGEVLGDTIIKNTVDIDDNLPLPSKFYLCQNYPNPFNPSTKIEYSIPKTSFVTLKVYDILGREVATLVNEEKSGGKYEVEFNGNGLSSGIYFYKLQAGNYTSVKIMILIK